jgi:hypothetical protein
MKFFRSIQLSNSGPRCKECAYFCNDPALIEEVYRGLTAMSSGFASVRDQDGFCNYHQLYLSARDNCTSFAPSEAQEEIKPR